MTAQDKIDALLKIAFECVMDAEQAVQERRATAKHFEKSYRTIKIAQDEARRMKPKRRRHKQGA